MKKLIIELIILMLFFIGIVAVLEFQYGKYKTPVDLIFEKIYSNTSASNIIVGNSHMGVLNDVNLAHKKTINLSLGGQDLFHAASIIQEAVNHIQKLETVILGIDYDMMGYSLSSTNQNFISRQYFQYTDTLQEANLTNKLLAKSSFFRANRDLSLLFTEHQQDFADEAQNFIPLASNFSRENCVKRAEEHSKIKFKNELISYNQQALAQIIKIVKKSNKRLILINPPKRKCYIESLYSANILKAKHALRETVNTNEKLMYLDYQDVDLFKDEDFVDADHLSEKGAKKLAALIQESLTSFN